MLTIVLVGAGQIGSRHLQSLASLACPAQIHMHDPSPEALATARSRFQDAKALTSNVNTSAQFSSNDDYPSSADIAIIATPSKPRLSVLRGLLAKTRIRFLLLEKVLFQSLEEYDAATSLIESASLDGAWVNCPSRLFPFYQFAAQRVRKKGSYTLSVVGSQWGLGCNSIHVLDAAQLVLGAKVRSLCTSGLDRDLIASKRSGYQEFTGTLAARLENGSAVNLTSYRAGCVPYAAILTGEDLQAVWDTSTLKYRVPESQWTWTEVACGPMLQSEMTSSFVEKVVAGGPAGLPTFVECAELHRKLISAFLAHMKDIGLSSNGVCPIT